MIQNQKINKSVDILFFVLLGLTAMNFYAKFFYLAILSTLVLFVLQPKIQVSSFALIYFLLSVLMSLYNLDEGFLSVVRCFVYLLFYIVGYNIVRIESLFAGNKKTDLCYKRGFWVLATISIGSFLHFTINFIYNYGKIAGRNTVDIWSKSTMAATGQAAIACLMIGFAVAVIFTAKKSISKIIGIFAILIMLAYNLILACRTMIVILMAVSFVGLMYVMRSSKSMTKRLKTVMIIMIAVFIIILLISVNAFGIYDLLKGSNFFNRFSGSLSSDSFDSSRMNAKLAYLKNGYKYLLGGLNLRNEYGYAHDLLLDGFDEYGILCAVILTIILASGIMEMYRFLKYSSASLMIKASFLCVYISIHLTFCVEPIMEGMPWLLVCYCLINGCVKSMNRCELLIEKGTESN